MRASRALCVIALFLLPLSAFAVGNPAAADTDCGVTPPGGTDVSDGLSFLDRPLEDALPRICTATATCSDGSTVSCSGSSSCSVRDGDCGYAECDGFRVDCGPCCRDEYDACILTCNDPSFDSPCMQACWDNYLLCAWG